jgi:chorismate synthase
MLRFLTSGESHGPGLVATVEGLPAGLTVTREGIAQELARRRLGFGRGPRMRLEQDELEILGGVRFARTLGGPVTVLIRNTEWEKWRGEMSPDAGKSTSRETKPRPGHADLVGMQKYDTHDARDILERASARETAARTVVGYLSKQLLAEVGVTVMSHVVAIGSVSVSQNSLPTPDDLSTIDASEVRAFDAEAEQAMMGEIEARTGIRSAALWKFLHMAFHPVWEAMCTGIENSMGFLPVRSCQFRRSKPWKSAMASPRRLQGDPPPMTRSSPTVSPMGGARIEPEGWKVE